MPQRLQFTKAMHLQCLYSSHDLNQYEKKNYGKWWYEREKLTYIKINFSYLKNTYSTHSSIHLNLKKKKANTTVLYYKIQKDFCIKYST